MLGLDGEGKHGQRHVNGMSLRLSLRVTHGRAVGRLRSYATEAAVHASKPSPYGQPLAASHAHLGLPCCLRG